MSEDLLPMQLVLQAQPKPAPKRGRPDTYSPEVGAEICDAIAAGLTLRQIAEQEDMPSTATIMRWAGKHDDFREMYTFALMALFDEWTHEMRAIAAGEPGDIPERDENGDPQADTASVKGVKQTIQRSRLEIETMWRIMAKRCPKVYGEPAATAAPAEPQAAQAPTPRPLVLVPKGDVFEVRGKAS